MNHATREDTDHRDTSAAGLPPSGGSQAGRGRSAWPGRPESVRYTPASGGEPVQRQMAVLMRSDSGPPQSSDPPAVSVVVCTRNRGCQVAGTIRSVLASVGTDIELVVVDQSTDDETADAVTEWSDDARVRYVRSDTVGVSRGRNLGLRLASHPIVLITDDDVEVQPDWARNFRTAMDQAERIAVGFCRVVAGPYDDTRGFVPNHAVDEPLVVRSLLSKSRARGMGAGMAVRLAPVLAMGGFDEELGPGARMRSGEDRDLAARCLVAGWWVCQTPTAEVVHTGFRTWGEGRSLARRDWYGIGAAYAKHVKCGRWAILPVLAHEVVWQGLVQPVGRWLLGERKAGPRRMWYFVGGLIAGLRTPLERPHLLYRPATSNTVEPCRLAS